eukprot:366275-Chlamydomonas_euryale.AAC.7
MVSVVAEGGQNGAGIKVGFEVFLEGVCFVSHAGWVTLWVCVRLGRAYTLRRLGRGSPSWFSYMACKVAAVPSPACRSYAYTAHGSHIVSLSTLRVHTPAASPLFSLDTFPVPSRLLSPLHPHPCVHTPASTRLRPHTFVHTPCVHIPASTRPHPHPCVHTPESTSLRPHACIHTQMVSLLHLAEITEEGVTFQSPSDGSRMLLTPEQSIQVQNRLGTRHSACSAPDTSFSHRPRHTPLSAMARARDPLSAMARARDPLSAIAHARDPLSAIAHATPFSAMAHHCILTAVKCC